MSVNGKSGWNRPSANQPTIKSKAKAPSMYKGIAAGLAIVVPLIAICLYLFSGGDAQKPERPAETKPKRITEKPAAVVKKDQPVPERKKWRPAKKAELTADVTPPARLTKDIIELGSLPTNCLLKKAIFKRNSDNLIAGIITAVPGDHFLTSSHWDSKFDEEFKESLKEKIEIEETDSEEDRLTKEAVIAAREMLEKSMAKGWKPSEIMNDAQTDLEKVTAYRDQLEEIMRGYLQKDELDEALKFKDEANELLKEYNATPLNIPQRKIDKISARLQEKEGQTL